jgi:anaerobic ribonucleoside-triphosphate reductase activating protein
MINLALTVPFTEAEGPGHRFALWVQGCTMMPRCAGCCNPEFLNFVPKTLITPESLAEQVFSTPGIEGVSILGGEPMAQAGELAKFARIIRSRGLSVMVFSGYTLDELNNDMFCYTNTLSLTKEFIEHIDLLVDGKYDKTKHSTKRRWIGSENQVLHFLTNKYSPDDPRFKESNGIEIRLINGKITLNGWPSLGAKTKIC